MLGQKLMSVDGGGSLMKSRQVWVIGVTKKPIGLAGPQFCSELVLHYPVTPLLLGYVTQQRPNARLVAKLSEAKALGSIFRHPELVTKCLPDPFFVEKMAQPR